MTYNYPCGGEAFASYRSKIWAIWITISIQHNPIVLFCYARILISTVMSLSEMLLHSQQKRIDFLSVHYPLFALGLWSVIWMIPGILKANRVQPRGNRIDGIGIASCLYGETLFMAKLLKSAAWFTWINTHTHRLTSLIYFICLSHPSAALHFANPRQLSLIGSPCAFWYVFWCRSGNPVQTKAS